VKRPKSNSNEGTTPAISDAEARDLLERPDADTLKGKRDQAILATLLYHGIRREELCTLRVKDLENRKGVPHLRIFGKGSQQCGRRSTWQIPYSRAPFSTRLESDSVETG
jgi:integrase